MNVNAVSTSAVPKAPTSFPYNASPFSSLCRTLWKSYLLSCRTKLAKLLCLKCFGRMVFVNFSFCGGITSVSSVAAMEAVIGNVVVGQHTSRTTKLSPSLLQRTTELYAGSSSILFDGG